MSRTADSIQADSGLQAGAAGTLLTEIVKGTIAVDLASIDPGDTADAELTITGAEPGDIVVLCPPTTAMTAGLLVGQAHVSDADKVKVRVLNTTESSIDESSASWTYLLIKS